MTFKPCFAEVRRATEEAEDDPSNDAKPEEAAQSSGTHDTDDEIAESKEAAPEIEAVAAEDVPAATGNSTGGTGINSNGQKGTLTGGQKGTLTGNTRHHEPFCIRCLQIRQNLDQLELIGWLVFKCTMHAHLCKY